MIIMPKEIRAPAHRGAAVPTVVAAAGGAPANQMRSASTWSPSDDEVLMSARASGLNWQPIASRHFPNKTANACRKRHERLMEKRNAEDWDGVKLETLAREYMAVRREMWTLLANRVGEKWQMVEQKCMEKGIKNLQSALRSAQRKERGTSIDDSGIGCSDAEHEIDESNVGTSGHNRQDSVNQEYVRHDQGASASAAPTQRQGPSIQSMLSPSHQG